MIPITTMMKKMTKNNYSVDSLYNHMWSNGEDWYSLVDYAYSQSDCIIDPDLNGLYMPPYNDKITKHDFEVYCLDIENMIPSNDKLDKEVEKTCKQIDNKYGFMGILEQYDEPTFSISDYLDSKYM